jgi:hypothetical protein
MKSVLTWAAVGIGAVLLLAIVGWIAGRFMPEQHRAAVTREIAAPIASLAARVRAVDAQATWRKSVKAIDVRARGVDGTVRYIERGSNGDIPFAFREIEHDTRFESVIDTDALAFGGRWTFELAAVSPNRTRITITEEGVVRPPLFRVFARYVFGHTSTIKSYLNDLAATVGA